MSQLVSLAATRQYVICSAGAPSALNPTGPINTSNMPTSTGRSVGIGPQLKVITAPDRVAFSVFGKGLVASLTDHEVGAVGVGAAEGSWALEGEHAATTSARLIARIRIMFAS